VSPKAVAATLFAAFSGCLHAADLNFEVAGLEKTEGQVLVALYDEAAFLKKPLKRLRLPASADGVRGSFSEIAEGAYALVVILDENSNGKLDFNAVGMPIEKMGFSNDASGFMGPPSFAAARFEVGSAAKSLVISLR
jgi:uncharacterized protein (DUF2141 family)